MNNEERARIIKHFLCYAGHVYGVELLNPQTPSSVEFDEFGIINDYLQELYPND